MHTVIQYLDRNGDVRAYGAGVVVGDRIVPVQGAGFFLEWLRAAELCVWLNTGVVDSRLSRDVLIKTDALGDKPMPWLQHFHTAPGTGE